MRRVKLERKREGGRAEREGTPPSPPVLDERELRISSLYCDQLLLLLQGANLVPSHYFWPPCL